MGDLSDDLLVEIFVRLPCKYVIQFKCVCKRWMSLISNPRFVPYFLDHHHHRNSPALLSSSSRSLFSKSKKTLPRPQCWRFIALVSVSTGRGESKVRFLAGRGPKVELPLFKPGLPFLPKVYHERKNMENSIFVLGCFKDLILCARGFPNASVYYICNPLTMQFLTLPPAPHVQERGCIGFICEPLSMYPNNRFRVVRFSLACSLQHFPLSPEYDLEIFSSETGLWSKNTLVVSYPTGMTPHLYCGVKFVSFENGQMILFTGSYIIKFDPLASGSQIKGQFIKLPNEFSDGQEHGSDRIVVVRQGRLFLLRISVLPDEMHYINIITAPQIMIWKECNHTVKDGESKWMLIHHVQFKEMKVIEKGVVTPVVGRITERWSSRRAGGPHNKEQRGIWLGNFLKSLHQSCFDSPDELTHEVVFVGFDLNCSYIMYLILCPPEPALAAFATYNMRTKAIKLLHKSKAPLNLRDLTGYGYDCIRIHHIFPFVQQPWPTPIPQPSI